MDTGWLVTGWVLVVAIVGGIVLRWSTVRTPLLIGLVGVVAIVLVVALAVLMVSAWRGRSRVLRLAAVGVLLAYLITFANIRAVMGCGPETAEDDIVVFHHNVHLNNGDPALVAASVAASDADVVVLMEVWPEFMDALARQPGVEGYVHRFSEPAYEPTGVAIWSRWALDEATVQTVARRPFLTATVAAPQGPFTLWAVHVSAPVDPVEVDDWEAQLAFLEARDLTRPTVVAGDFNATIDHAQFRSLLETSYTDVHTPKGCGLDLTWPADGSTGFALMRLDHILVTDHFEVLGLELGSADGSDHRSLIATIRFDDG